MKKTILFLLVSMMTLSFNACSSDDDDNGDGTNVGKEVIVSITANYKSDGKEIADVGAVVYVFNALSVHEEAGWKYIGNGEFESEKWNRKTKYTYKEVMKENGISFLLNQLPDGKYFTVVIESATDINKESRYFGITTFDYKDSGHNLKYLYGSQNIERIN